MEIKNKGDNIGQMTRIKMNGVLYGIELNHCASIHNISSCHCQQMAGKILVVEILYNTFSHRECCTLALTLWWVHIAYQYRSHNCDISDATLSSDPVKI